ncbi:transposase, partial [Streptomyces sp. NRRL F-5053]|uniref:transposase n=1 Tax=Streptomyces sp. NRRL F-5053 TaxID=1463854 RepID=UPI0013311741
MLDELGARGELERASAIVDTASARARRGRTDRAELGRSRQEGQQAARLVRGPGHPVTVAVSAANTNDILALTPLMRGIPAVRSWRGPRRRRPVKLRADKTYFSAEQLAWLRARSVIPRIARPGVESSKRPCEGLPGSPPTALRYHVHPASPRPAVVSWSSSTATPWAGRRTRSSPPAPPGRP